MKMCAFKQVDPNTEYIKILKFYYSNIQGFMRNNCRYFPSKEHLLVSRNLTMQNNLVYWLHK